MRRYFFVPFVVLAVLIQYPVLLQACGEKLLVLGRSIRFQARHTPRAASVLLYLPQTSGGRPLSDPNLETALKEAGHAVRAVTTSAELENALRTESYDVVVANITDAPELDRARALTDRGPFVLPAVYLVVPSPQSTKPQMKAERESASKTFGVVVEVPGRPGHYCAAVDKAMELKLKRERANARRP